MLIKALRSEFYNVIKSRADHVLVLVARDVDSVCASLLLQHAFRIDHQAHTVVSVGSIEDVVLNIRSQDDKVSYMVLINCCATQDILLDAYPPDENEEQNIPEQLRIFVVDSRRPFHLDNVYDSLYSRHLFMVVDKDEDLSTIPAMDDVIYQVDSDDEEYDELAHSRWKKRLNKILWRYYQFTYHETPASLLMLRLVHELSLSSTEQCWLAIVGVTSTFLDGKRDKMSYANDCATGLRPLLRSAAQNVQHKDTLSITFDRDIWMPCYRHWSLYDSAYHCMTLYSRFQLWSQTGSDRLYKFFAHIGLPINECKQRFSSMKTELRKEIVDGFYKCCEAWKAEEVLVDTFTCKWSYSNCISAFEHAAAAATLIHMDVDHKETNDEQRFLNAARCLQTREGVDDLYKGVKLFEHYLGIVVKECTAAMQHSYVMPCASYLHLQVQSQAVDAAALSHPAALVQFGRFFIRTFMATSRGKKRYRGVPLVVSVPVKEPMNHHVLAAISPIEAEEQQQCRTLMPRAFERAADIARVQLHALTFDGSVIRLRTQDKVRFLDCLMSCLGPDDIEEALDDVNDKLGTRSADVIPRSPTGKVEKSPENGEIEMSQPNTDESSAVY